MHTKFYDAESGAIITRAQLEAEFNSRTEAERAEYDNCFTAWLDNCFASTLDRFADYVADGVHVIVYDATEYGTAYDFDYDMDEATERAKLEVLRGNQVELWTDGELDDTFEMWKEYEAIK